MVDHMDHATPGRAVARRRRQAAGFTLLELLVVVALVGILTAIALPRLASGPRRAKEAVLNTNLHTIREVLDQYYADKQRCAESLEVLVDDGYLREIPVDPMTGSRDAWTLEHCEGEDAELSALQEGAEGFGGPGIYDVHSSSELQALDGSYYADW